MQVTIPVPSQSTRVSHGGDARFTKLISDNGRAKVEVQKDRNIVLTKDSVPIWASGTNSDSAIGPFYLDPQNDGNLVAYDAAGPFWASNTYMAGPGPYKSIVQDDANFVHYDGQGTPLWSTGTGGQ